MKSIIYLFIVFTSIFTIHSELKAQDWTESAILPGERLCEIHKDKEVCFRDGNRENILELPKSTFKEKVYKGAKHTLYYPTDSTNLYAPYKSMLKIFDSKSDSIIKEFIFKVARRLTNFKNTDELYNWIGLNNYPRDENQLSPNPIPYMGEEIEEKPMGVTIKDVFGTKALTISCAACHSANLFGTKILGMSNRFPKANETFRLGKRTLARTPSVLFQSIFTPDEGEMIIFKNSKKALNYVEVKKPIAIGLDTSLAQVGLSLSKRARDEYASRKWINSQFPRSNPLNTTPADSKPQIWWNLKYKTKWLSDGSIVSGNPVHTNILWNEIGRGADLKELELWLQNNKKIIDELTAFVFSTKAPKYDDFFPGEIDLFKAKKGQELYRASCSGCHGIYQKGWENPESIDYKDQIKTTKVWYHEKTPIKDVGTDPLRYQGMNYFYKDLNRLKISKEIKTLVKPQKGYIPPPLIGVWARWPYFHNNSVPSLYDVITIDTKRARSYIAVEAIDKDLDFDKERNGYPTMDQIRDEYRNNPEYFFDTNKRGMSNRGHTSMLTDELGNEKFTHEQKLEIIEYLKTL